MFDFFKRGGLVYFAQDEATGIVKIGFTSISPRRRVRALCRRRGLKLKIIGIQVGTLELEARLHRKFRNLSIGEERFRPGPQLMAYIDGLEYEDAFVKQLQAVIEATPRFAAMRRKR